MITCQGRLPKALARTPCRARLSAADAGAARGAARRGGACGSAGLGARPGRARPSPMGWRWRGGCSTGAGGAGAARAGGGADAGARACRCATNSAWLFAATGRADRLLHRRRRLPARSGRCWTAGLDLVVGTPGRLRDHLRQGGLAAAAIGCVVLDEADDMLERGLPRRSRGGARRAAGGAADADVLGDDRAGGGGAGAAASRSMRCASRSACRAGMALQAVAVAPADREAAIVNLLRLHDARAALVFCGRREAVGHLAARLAARGFAVAALSGALTSGGATRRWRRCARGGRGSASPPTSRRAASTCRGWIWCCTPTCRGRARCCCTAPAEPGGPGAAGSRCWWCPGTANGGRLRLAARAGVTIDWVAAPDRADVLARDLERMLADPALARQLGPERGAGGRTADGSVRAGAAGRGLRAALGGGAAVTGGPGSGPVEAATRGRPLVRGGDGAGGAGRQPRGDTLALPIGTGFAAGDPADADPRGRGARSRSGRSAAWGFAAAAEAGGVVRRLQRQG